MVIDMQWKIWRPKVRSKYKPSLFNKNVDEGVLTFESLGNAVFRPKLWKPDTRNDVIKYNESRHAKEFSALKINEDSAGALLPTLMQIFKKVLGLFCC